MPDPDPRPVLLLTRPEMQAEAFAREFQDTFGADWPVVVSPVICIRALPPPPADIARANAAAAVVFSSANAVKGFTAVSPPQRRVAWCVGEATARAAQAEGFSVRIAEGDAVSLTRLITQAAPEGPLIHARGRHVAAAISQDLRKAGRDCGEITVYDQCEQALTPRARQLLAAPGPVLVPLFSPRSAHLVRPELERARASLRLVAISAAAARALDGLPARIAASPDADAMLSALGDELGP